jgi:hypothetical protein
MRKSRSRQSTMESANVIVRLGKEGLMEVKSEPT